MPGMSLQQESLGDRLAHALRVQIITGTLSPGTHLVEDSLAETFDVSRGPVRDALKQLETEGLLESRRRGVFVKGLTARDVDELYSLRETLETMALKLAIARAKPAEWTRAAEYLTELRRSADQADARAFAGYDLDFHTQFYLLSGHRRLADVWEQYRPTFAVMLSVTTAQDDDLHPSAEAHADLLAAIHRGDAAAAAAMLADHLLGSGNRLRTAMQNAAASG
jgi:GntR family transcriptional regulator of gluconate operon